MNVYTNFMVFECICENMEMSAVSASDIRWETIAMDLDGGNPFFSWKIRFRFNIFIWFKIQNAD